MGGGRGAEGAGGLRRGRTFTRGGAQGRARPEELIAGAGSGGAKQALKEATEEAAGRGVFATPTFFVGEEMFWGNDRLDFVREALMA
ncbi:hypothetical protein GBA65_16300 [Rubrobacter marinus]|uniref:DSBA-like thioredoxin domain-containing protein n=1 Tax=Rubrobacter marinus TaxID=2653852 RepID=A0A6G8Q3F8_9ACTN|nr:hypothetical protein GBA65_16300 [Rubrobacter marinus]